MLFSTFVPFVFGVGAAAQVTAQNSSGTRLRVDNGTYGPEIEEVHYCESRSRALNIQRLQPLTTRKTTTNGQLVSRPHQTAASSPPTPAVTTATPSV